MQKQPLKLDMQMSLNVTAPFSQNKSDFEIRGLYHKTYYSCNLHISVKTRVFVHGKPIQSNICGRGKDPTLEWST